MATRKSRAAANKKPDIKALATALRRGERRALARAVTLVESTRADHRRTAEALLEAMLPETGRAIRIGISGTPGVGKSTFIEVFGLMLIERGHKVAVLAVDPSSAITGGSILGDKTRMERLARSPDAYIRPSPASGTLGGVARRTREAMLLLEAAGFDIVLVETVGVGQSETAVADMVDIFLLLLAPGGGDELQGIKRGVMELADLVLINKADGDLAPAARRAAAEYTAALQLMRPKSKRWLPRVLLVSALKNDGIDAVWNAIEAWRAAFKAGGELERMRAAQARAWMWRELTDTLSAALRAHRGVAAALPKLEAKVASGALAPGAAARRLLAIYLGEAKAKTGAET